MQKNRTAHPGQGNSGNPVRGRAGAPPIVNQMRVLWIGPGLEEVPVHLCEEWEAETIPSGAEGIYWAAHACGAIVIACPLPDMSVAELLEELARLRTKASILIHDRAAGVAEAVRYVRLGEIGRA